MKRRLTTTLTVLLLCICMVFGLTACDSFTQDNIDNAVNEATESLNEQITALEADIAEKKTKITTLESEKNALTAEKTELLANVKKIEAEITALKTEKATLEAELAALKEEKSALTADKASLESSITAKNNEIATLNSSISALEAEKANLEEQVTNLQASISAKDTEIANLNSSVATLTAEKQTLADRVANLEAEKEALEEENSELQIRINCLEGKHVINETETISYVYTWDETAPTSTINYTCLHCEKAIEETVSASVWQADDKVTYIAKDGNPYVCTVGEITDSKAVLVSDGMWSTGKTTTSQEKLLAIVEDKGARVPSSTEAVWSNIIEPWLSSTLPASSGGSSDKTESIVYNSSGVFSRVVNYHGISIFTSGMSEHYTNNNTWVGRYIWDVEFSTAE